ncbi:MAG: hypothetical protein Q4E56_03190 [Pseudomonadota bacterium]|nr:hypothetical protein [Pseudomonadota bacterium]
MNGFFEYFAGSGFPVTTMIMVIAVIFIFVVLMMYMPALTRRILPQFGYKRYARYLPFQTVYNDDSLELSDGSLLRVYRVAGVQTSMQDAATREKFLELRTQLFNQIRDPNVVMRFFMTRDATDENTDYEFDQPVLQKIYDKWQAQGLRIFLNNYYIVLQVSGASAREKLNQYGNYLESILAAYQPKLLRNNSTDNMARFFGRILSPITKPAPIVCDNRIADLVTVDDVEFMRDGVVRYISGGSQTFAAMMSFRMSPDYLDEEFFDIAPASIVGR